MADMQAISMHSLGIGDGSGPGSGTNEVLAVVSHDLRSPLNIIALGASLLDGSDRTEAERATILSTIKRATARMDRLIEDLLTLVRIDGGCGLAVSPAAMDVAGVIQEVRDSFLDCAQAQGRQLQCRVPAGLPSVYADADRLHQVFANLIGNALKFTPPGGTIAVEAERARDEVRCSVSDTGAGMTEDQLERVFDPFWQADRRSRAGFGLGLKISKCIVEAHGGTMHVSSVPGAGSTFSFTLPLAKPNGSGEDLREGPR
jgi:signal transduction histidine kinase